MPRFTAQNPVLQEFHSPVVGGGHVTISPLGNDYQIAHFADDGRLLFVANRSRYHDAQRLAMSMAAAEAHDGVETLQL